MSPCMFVDVWKNSDWTMNANSSVKMIKTSAVIRSPRVSVVSLVAVP